MSGIESGIESVLDGQNFSREVLRLWLDEPRATSRNARRIRRTRGPRRLCVNGAEYARRRRRRTRRR